MKVYRFSLLACALALSMGPATASAVSSTEHIENGDFETGDFTGWQSTGGGFGEGFSINDGSFDPPGPGSATPPINGSYDAVSSQTGEALNMVSQSFLLDSNIALATISWSDRIENWAGQFVDPGQEFRVVIQDASGNDLYEVFSTDPGDPASQPGPNHRLFDVTAVAQLLGGQEIQLAFQEQDGLFFFNVSVDDVSFTTTPVPEPSAALVFVAGLLAVRRGVRR
ncbi:MAG: hypothetical protein JRH19_12615 [Deltaproteobacteria bacterium]|nr:hypothetical protein [Deltaproteobacteria bacterium]